MRYFVKVVETGNITHAAQELNLAQTALGIQIRNLEETLQMPLLERHSRGVSPTRAGKLLYDRAVDIIGQVEEVRLDILSLGRDVTPVKLGTTPSILRVISGDLVVAAKQDLPDISLHLVEGLSFIVLEALKRGELDYILAYDIPDDPNLRRYAVLQEDLLHVSVANGENLENEISFRDAVKGDLALASHRDAIWNTVHSTARRLSIDVQVTYEVQSVQGMENLISRGVAHGIMPYGTVAHGMKSGQLVARRIVRPALQRTLFLATSAKRRTLADEQPFLEFIDRMIDLLCQEVGPYMARIGRING